MSIFEWDESKNQENLAKHQVSFDTAVHAFLDMNRVVAKDITHSTGSETRYFCFGMDRNGNGILTVRFTLRNSKIRIFGAGYWRKGKRIYEEENRVQRRSGR